MAKLYYFMIMTVGLTILMKVAGIEFGGESMLDWVGISLDIQFITSSAFYIALTLFFLAAAGIGAVLSNREASLRAGFIWTTTGTGILGMGIGTFVGILNHIKNINQGASDIWIYYVVLLIFSVYIIGYIMALFEWWSTGQ